MPIPKLIVTGLLVAANMAMSMTRRIEGQRLDDLSFTGADPGSPWPNIWGTRRTNCIALWALPLEEVKQQRKTKGGKFNDYSYFERSAYGVAGHEIAAFRRIFADKHPVYDLSGTGPVTPFDFGGTGTISDFLALYLGTPDQDPDPYMQAFVEDDLGEGWCPAYRNRAYFVVKRMPIEKFGNRRPVYEVEVSSGASFPVETKTFWHETGGIKFARDYATLALSTWYGFSIIDTATGLTMASAPFDPIVENGSSGFEGYNGAGGFYALRHPGDLPYLYAINGIGAEIASDAVGLSQLVTTCFDSEGRVHWNTFPGVVNGGFLFDGAGTDPAALTGTASTLTYVFAGRDGKVWAQGYVSTTECCFYELYPLPGANFFMVTGLPSLGAIPVLTALHYRDAEHDQFVFSWGGKLYAADTVSHAVVASNLALATPSAINRAGFDAVSPLASTMYVGFEELSLADLTRVRLLDAADWGMTPMGSVYDPIKHALIIGIGSFTPTWCYLDRVGVTGVTLGSILGDLAARVGITASDFSALDQVVPGWSSTQGDARSMIEPLVDLFDSDIRPHDFTVQGLKRGAASALAIVSADFARIGEVLFKRKKVSPDSLPRQIAYKFADQDKNQQPNVAYSPRSAGGTGERTIDLSTLAHDTDTMRNLADRHFRRIVAERGNLELSLTAQQLALEPGDAATIELDGISARYRAVRTVVKADQTISSEWKFDRASLATLGDATGAELVAIGAATVAVPMLSKGFFLDIPYLADSYARTPPSLTLAASSWTAGGTWPGASAFQAVDGEYSEELGALSSADRASWGYVAEELPARNPNLWDRLSELTVTMQYGTLTGCTEADIDADPTRNMAAIGRDGRWELVNFTTATLDSPGVYLVSGFKRGRRGTEWACGLHAAGDELVLLGGAVLANMGLSEVGTDLSFKMVTGGRTAAGAFPVDLAPYTGASLKPYAPASVSAAKQANGDWKIYGTRRTRLGGAWRSGAVVPLSEASEAYEIDLFDGATDLLKTTAALPFTWTVATQIADMGAEIMPGEIVYGAVIQISAAVGRGFAAEFTA